MASLRLSAASSGFSMYCDTMLTSALPTIAPSAPDLMMADTCSGREMPNPAEMGIFPFASDLTELTASNAWGLRVSLDP